MKLPKLLALFLIATIIISACKKEELTAQTAVQKQILGKWYLKFDIQTIAYNGVIIKITPDTVKKYTQIDTVIFVADGTVIRRNKTVLAATTYTISADGESISYGSKPDSVKKISFISPSRLGLALETNSGTTKTIKTTHLLRY